MGRGMTKNQQRDLFTDDEDGNNTDEGEGEISNSDASVMEEPDDLNVRRAEANNQKIALTSIKKSVG